MQANAGLNCNRPSAADLMAQLQYVLGGPSLDMRAANRTVVARRPLVEMGGQRLAPTIL